MEKAGSESGKPASLVKIVDCGEVAETLNAQKQEKGRDGSHSCHLMDLLSWCC